MKKILIYLMLLFLVVNVSAVRINEVELNPPGKDAGAEWVEIYFEEQINLDGWKIVNNDGDEYFLNSSSSEYYVINFEKQWLDNSDEKIFLYNENNLIDETDLFKDSENDDKTWQYCNSWEFRDSSKNSDNGCIGQNNNIEEEFSEIDIQENNTPKEEPLNLNTEKNTEDKSINRGEEDNSEDYALSTKNKKIINLNPQQEDNSRVIYKSKNENIKDYTIYGFVFFLIFVIIILLIKD